MEEKRMPAEASCGGSELRYMSVLIFSSLAIFGAFVLALFVYRAARKFHFPLPGPVARVGGWTDHLISYPGEEKTATFGDLVLFVTLWIIAFTLWFIFSQGSEERFKEQLGEANEKVLSLQGNLRDQQNLLQEVRQKVTFPLPVLPRADEQIIGTHVDLQWESKQEIPGQDYVIEVTMIAENAGKVPAGKACMYRATEPSSHRSRYPIDPGDVVRSGIYIWRVAAGSLRTTRHDDLCPSDERIRGWSGYSKFTIYGTQEERLLATGEVLVGTSFNPSTPFGRQGADGSSVGFEIDLIRTILEECVVRMSDTGGKQEPRIRYDPHRCRDKIGLITGAISEPAANRPPSACERSDCALHSRFIELGSGDDWQDKMQRRNLDLYVGTLTRAKEREHGNTHFAAGYLAYESELLTNTGEEGSEIEEVSTNSEEIGVIENSTNQWLAEALHDQYSKLSVHRFPSFAALESAFEQREVGLAVVDGVVVQRMGGNRTVVNGLQKTRAWGRYMARIGYPTEKFGFAVADDTQGNDGASNRNTSELRTAINDALEDKPIREMINYLFQRYELWNSGARRCNYPSDSCWEKTLGGRKH
jgi:ABC-type amino acid transport substrate-binding protein